MNIKELMASIEKETGKLNWGRVFNPSCKDKTFEEWAALEMIRASTGKGFPVVCAITDKTN